MSPWLYALVVVAIIAYVVSIAILALVAGGSIWVTLKMEKCLVSIAESLEKMKVAVAALPESLAKIEKVSAELHDLQEGEIRVLGHVEKAIKDLVGTVEELQGMLFKPRERVTRTAPAGEDAEMVAEQRRQQREGTVDLERLKEVGKNVGSV